MAAAKKPSAAKPKRAKATKKKASAPSVPPPRPSAPPPRPSSPPPRPSAPPRASTPPARRPTTRPPPPLWESRTARAPWPEPWLPEGHDVALAQDVMLMAYWIADQLGDAGLPESRRKAMTATLRGVASALRAGAEGVVAFSVAATVRRNGALLAEAQSYERERVASDGILEALLAGHEDEAVHACLREIGEHSPDVAAWLEELERRGRPELRNALREKNGTTRTALERLLTVVLFATKRRS